jgi:hypothetical protein
MKSRFLKIFIAAALVASGAWIAPSTPAYANGQVLCAAEVSGGSTGPRRVVNTSSTASPQPAYQLNSAGCAYILQADVGFFLSQGYTAGPDSGAVIVTTGVQTGTTNVVLGTLPAGAYVSSIIVVNSTANAVTGGIAFGTTANGTNIVAALTCAANCVAAAPGNAVLAGSAFSATATTSLNAAAVTAWNNANVTITVVYRYF